MADASTPATTPAPASSAPKDWLAFVTYFIPIVLIYTMMKKGSESNYVWHSKNAAGALVIYLIIQILASVLFNILPMIVYTIFNLVSLAMFILMLYGGWQAANGKLPTLPVVTQIGQKIPLEKWFHGSAATAQSTAAAPVSAPAAPTPTPVAAPATPAPMPEPTPAPTAPAAPAPTEPTPPTPPAPTTQA